LYETLLKSYAKHALLFSFSPFSYFVVRVLFLIPARFWGVWGLWVIPHYPHATRYPHSAAVACSKAKNSAGSKKSTRKKIKRQKGAEGD
jgi:hypothetical protein